MIRRATGKNTARFHIVQPQPNDGTVRVCPLIGKHFILPRARPCSPWLLLAARGRTTGSTGGHGESQQSVSGRLGGLGSLGRVNDR